MRLSCPNCLTEYEVPDAAIAGRTRTLRCAQCGEQWTHGAMAARAIPEAPQPPQSLTAGQDPAVEWTPAPPPMPDLPADYDVVPEVAAILQEAPRDLAQEPAFTWATPPAVPAGWPEFTVENASIEDASNTAPEEAARSFGVPADDVADSHAEDAVAAAPVVPAPGDVASTSSMTLPEPNSKAEVEAPSLRLLTDEDFRLAARPPEALELAETAEHDSFAALVSAARRKSLEYEPEPAPPPPPVRTSSKPLFFILLILFLLGMAVLERHLIIHILPSSAKLFQGLGLK